MDIQGFKRTAAILFSLESFQKRQEPHILQLIYVNAPCDRRERHSFLKECGTHVSQKSSRIEPIRG